MLCTQIPDDNEALRDDQLPVPFKLDQDTVFDLIWPGTFVGLKSPKNSIEPFILCKIISNDTASETLTDTNGHTIIKGEKYAEVVYLQKTIQRGCKVKYEMPKKSPNVYLHIGEVAVTNIEVNVDLSMHVNEYIYVSNATL